MPTVTPSSGVLDATMLRLLTAHGLGTVAQQLVVMATALAVFRAEGSGVWASVAMSAGYAPYAVLSLLAGVVVDRHARGTVLIVSTGLRVVLTLILVAALITQLPPWVPVTLVALMGVLATLQYPALAAAVALRVDRDRLTRANAAAAGVENVAWLAGPGVFGLLLLIGEGGPRRSVVVTVVLACALFGLATVAVLGLDLPRPARALAAGPDPVALDLAGLDPIDRRQGGRTGLAAIVASAWRRRTVRSCLIASTVNNFAYGVLLVALVLIAAGDDATLGRLNTALTVGACVGMALLSGLRGPATSLRSLTAQIVVFLGCLALLGWAATGWPVLALVAVSGVFTLTSDVFAVTALQCSTSHDVHGRMLGLYDQLAVGAIAVGSLVSGPVIDRFGIGRGAAAAGVVLLVFLLLLRPWRRDPASVPVAVGDLSARASDDRLVGAPRQGIGQGQDGTLGG